MRSPAVVLGPAIIYVALVVPDLIAVLPSWRSPICRGSRPPLGTPRGATIAWMHFLAFDLFVGRWVYLDARLRGAPSWRLAPVLLLVLMLGPLGLAAYLAMYRRCGEPST